MKTDYQVTKEILNILIGYNLKNIAIFSEKKHLLEEVDSLVKKIYMVKDDIKNWLSNKDEEIRRIPNLAFSEKTVKNLKSIKIGNVHFLSLDNFNFLISNLSKIHHYSYEWLRYLAEKYPD